MNAIIAFAMGDQPRVGPPGERYRVVFMGTPSFAVPTLRRLLDSQQVVAVFTQPDRPAGRGRHLCCPPVKDVALASGVEVYQPKSLRRDRQAVAELASLEPDVVVVAAYALILPPEVLTIPASGALNVHASLLPRWRGAAPVTYSILHGDPETGATIMLMDEGLDTGPILAQQRVVIQPDETAGELTDRLAVLGADLLADTLPRWMAGRIEPTPQDEEQATYAPRIDREQAHLDFSRSALELERQVRAMNPWPGAFTLCEGKVLKVHAATALLDGASQAGIGHDIGHVVETEDGPAVKAGEGLLRLDVVQPAGGRKMSGADYVCGRPGFVGDVLDECSGETA